VIKLPEKKYTPKQDVQLGKEAASEVRKQYPIIEDQHIAKYLTQIGNRLVAAAQDTDRNGRARDTGFGQWRQFGGVAAEPLDQRSAYSALQRSEREYAAPVMGERELEQAAAQTADTVVEHRWSASA
jgi:hypothetical protein